MHVGSRYDSSRDIVDIARCFREDVTAAKKLEEGNPRALPKSLKLSVRTRRFAGGRAVDVAVTACGEALLNPAAHLMSKLLPHEREQLPRFTKEAARVLRVLERLLAEYNFDKSDAQSDYFHVGFYGHVDVDWRCEKAHRALLEAAQPPYETLGRRVAELEPDIAITVAAGQKGQALAQLETLNEGYLSIHEQQLALRLLMAPRTA